MKTLVRKPVFVLLALIVVVALWAAFRPELLFVRTAPANDPFPTSAPTAAPTRP